MPWLELTLNLPAEHREEAEAALEELGALSITLHDADVDTADEQAIFEPGVGETPLWASLVLGALFDADHERTRLAGALARQLPWLEPDRIQFRDVADQDWERAWMDRFKPMQFGRRLWVYPWNIEPDAPGEKVIVRLDPGLAFGTGTHPTTAMCLEWLDGLDLSGRTLVDYGCGSGVLAIAALKLGAEHVTGIDNDPQALAASEDNARRNDVDQRLALYLPDDAPAMQADALVANILAGPLGELAPRMAALCKPGAWLALSGILDGQHLPLLERYARWFTDLDSCIHDGWVRITGRRSPRNT
ncbi:MAG: 50S ribosomal protein L11 methyltransferase [Rhodanobacteraceae bacterium]